MVETKTGIDLKKGLLAGMNKMNTVVSSTLGPGGRNVIIQDGEKIKITKDGVSCATSFTELEDPIENLGMSMLKQVSIRSADKAGDGTTTSTLLATFIVNEGVKSITQGSNPIEVKKGIDKAVKAVIAKLKEISTDITDVVQIKQVATLSANGDTEVGTLISTALEKVGNDGVVAIEESKTGETSLEVVEGMMFDRGFKSPYFVTDNNLMQSVLEKPAILLFDGRITTTAQIVPSLQAAATSQTPLLIVAEDIEAEALALLVINKAQGTIKVCAVKAPDFGERRTAILEDIAILTGGKVLSPTKGHKLDKLKADDYISAFGHARMVTVSSKDTTIIDGKGEIEAIETRLMEIKSQIDVAKSNFEIENLQQRLSKLTGGVAIINVGGLSELELNEKKDRVDDALHATKAAIDQGIVPGGGIALISCIESLKVEDYDNSDQLLGMSIIKKALYEPFKTILINAGIEDHFKILSEINHLKIGSNDTLWFGYNVKSGKYVNLLEDGVIDPTKITRTAIENAASVAGTILTTESCVFTIKSEKAEDQQYM